MYLYVKTNADDAARSHPRRVRGQCGVVRESNGGEVEGERCSEMNGI